MASYRAQIAWQFDSALPRDAVCITPHFDGLGGNAQAIADNLNTKLAAITAVGATPVWTIKVYDALRPKPNPPLAIVVHPGGGSPTTSFAPRDVALCLSFFAGVNSPRRRGRLYIPMNFVPGSLGLRPTSAQRSSVAAFVPALTTGYPTSVKWAVYSRRDGATFPVTDWFVDDEWDTQRKRGLRSTTRTTGTVP